MKRNYLPFFAAALLLGILGATNIPSGFADAAARTPTENLLLPTSTGKTARIAELLGKQATVLIFVGTNCPISNRYAPDIAKMAAAYQQRGVATVLVYPNAGVSLAEVRAHMARYGLGKLRAVLDSSQQLADIVGATVTPEVAVLGKAGQVLYRGRLDDRWSDRAAPRTVSESADLSRALTAILAGKDAPEAGAPAVGCVIERAAPAVANAAKVTYAHDVAPILNQNCVSCHREGEIGPLLLTGYDNAKRYAKNIAVVTESALMPPWKPVAGHGDFDHPRRLTEKQIQTLKNWADAGAPSGDLSEAPPAPKFTSGWALGQPDLVLTMPAEWTIPASGADDYRCFVLPTNLTEEKDIAAIEYRAGNKSVVHHVLGYVDTKGRGRAKDEAAAGLGYTSFGGPGFAPDGEMGGWAPGNLPRFLPDGIARRLPAGSDLILQVHYHPNGRVETDKTQVGLYFAKTATKKELRTFPFVAPVRIPAGDAVYKTSATFPVPLDVHAISVMPHMHLLGRTIQMTLTLPDGTTKSLVKIGDWDFNWQDTYYYKEPVAIPKGSKITIEAAYDNSADNPRNPNSPPKQVTWGEKTTDEMCIGFLGFTADDENDPLLRFLDLLGGNNRRKEAKAN